MGASDRSVPPGIRSEGYAVTNRAIACGMPFYVHSYGHSVCDSRYYVRRTYLAEHLMLYTVRGAGRIRTGAEEYLLPPGHLSVFDCRLPHCYASSGAEWEFYWIHFDGQAAGLFFALIPGLAGGAVPLSDGFSMPEWYGKLVQTGRCMDRHTELRLSGLMHALLEAVAAQAVGGDGGGAGIPHRADILRTVQYMEAHYGEALDIRTLSRLSRLSRYYFIRRFREVTGETPYRYLTRLRINRSKELLLAGGMRVSEIAEAVGFPDSKSYIACFRKYQEMTPLQYRTRFFCGETERRQDGTD